MEILLDGGIRRGSDVVKALALGASACLIGRPWLYGLAAAGQQGVETVLDILRAEIDQTMALVGCADVADLDPSFIRYLDAPSRSAPEQGRSRSLYTAAGPEDAGGLLA